jgi:hypothetical protein
MAAVIQDACACGQPVEAQHQRHLTQAEYDALPEGLRPNDGWATAAVKTCGDCAPPPFCEHPDATPVPCPTCGALPGDQCVRADGGGVRIHPHPARAAAQPVPETCRHAHREDCDHRDCRCTGDDQPPVRAGRSTIPGGAPPDLSALGFPIEMIPAAMQWLAAHGIDRTLVRGGFRSGFTQDNRAALLFDYVTASDDGHGHEVVELRVMPVETPQG